MAQDFQLLWGSDSVWDLSSPNPFSTFTNVSRASITTQPLEPCLQCA